MPLTPRFCTQCGSTLVSKMVENRKREVCPKCGTISYQNPLPVASTVLLNDRREVLLVKRKREPKQGMWCLPIGFAETEETIDEAALRELREETGVEGHLLQLLDVDSLASDYYGDLLVVTFQAVKDGGTLQAGDDAEAVGWFGLNDLPELAFPSNKKALVVCQEIHREEWAIQDSFERMHSGKDEEMLSDVLVSMIQERAPEIARIWVDEVLANPTTASYREIDSQDLAEKATAALLLFGRWLKGDQPTEEVNAFYRAVGSERRAKGVSHYEILSALMLLRKNIWQFIRGLDILRRPIDVYRVLELNRRLTLFFDKAMYHTAKQFSLKDDKG